MLNAVPLKQRRDRLALPKGANVVVVGDESGQLAVAIRGDGLVPVAFGWSDDPAACGVTRSGALILCAPESLLSDLGLRAFRWVRHFGRQLREAATKGPALLASVTRLDGSFGVAAAQSPTQGSLAGIIKTASHEWPEVRCRALDVQPGVAAADLWTELGHQGPLETGLTADGAIELRLASIPAPPLGTPIRSSDVVVITGGARGVTSAVAEVIAERHRPTLVLLGRTAIEVAEPSWLHGCHTEPSIKQALAKHGSLPSPKAIAGECQRIIAAREGRATVQRLRAHGSKVLYVPVDVANADAVERALAEVRKTTGPVTHVIHGAGVLADRRIEDLTDEQFAMVYTTKVAGIEALLQATARDPLKAIVLFSSSTGRFGRTGQVAYAAANEALNKIARREQHRRPDAKVVAINWGPWDGGMVTPALKEMFASEGVGVIPLREGAEVLLRELDAPRSDVEVVVIARPFAAEPNGVDATPLASPLNGHVAFDQRVSIEDCPVLASHVIGGRAVLPLALHAEYLAHAAIHGNPGLSFLGFNDLRLLNGVQIDPQKPVEIQAFAGKAEKKDGLFAVPVELRGIKNGRDVVYSRSVALLGAKPLVASRIDEIDNLRPYSLAVREAYNQVLFHGPDLYAVERFDGVGDAGIVAWCRPAPAPANWLKHPLRRAWIADPLVLDAAFQLMILWSVEKHGRPCLPAFVGHYRQYVRTFPSVAVQVRVKITQDRGTMAKADIQFVDADGRLIAEMRDHESVVDENLTAAFRKNRLAGGNSG